MKIFASVDSFKGTISSKDISQIIEVELSALGHTVEICPISDGGEGFVEALKAHFFGDGIYVTSVDALNRKIECEYVLVDHVAYIEMNSSAGITLLKKEELNPLITSTFGVGLIVMDAIKKGAKEIVIGIGGSSTNDGGAGMLQALGVDFYVEDMLVSENMNGTLIGNITSFNTDQLVRNIKGVKFSIFSDVKNPLLGKNGCSAIYSPQKGANKDTVMLLEKHMSHFSALVERHFQKKVIDSEGSGAAGGFGFGAVTFLNATISSGIFSMIKLLNIEESVKRADVVIVGEGKLDLQTIFGKAPAGIAQIAKKHDKTVIGVFGMIESNVEYDFLDHIFSVVPNYASESESIANPKRYFTNMIKEMKI